MYLFAIFLLICANILAQDHNGNWLSYPQNGYQNFEIRYSKWNRTSMNSMSFNLVKIKDDNNFRHELKREVGTMIFKGIFKDGNGVGTFEFTVDEDFKKFLEEKKIKIRKAHSYIIFMTNNLNKDQINYFDKKYGDLSEKELRDICIFNLTEDFDKEMTGTGLRVRSLSDLKKMAIHDVDEEFVKHVKKYDRNADYSDVVKYKIHNLDFEEYEQIKALGFDDFPVKKYLKFKIHGLDYDDVKVYQDAFDEDITIDRIIKMKIHGVDKRYIKKIKRALKKD